MSVLRIGPDDDLPAAVRGCAGESVVVVIAGGDDDLALALAKAAIGPLAVERAPGMRVNAVVEGEGADPGDVGAAIAFLDSVRSTTGQVIKVC